MRRWWGLLVLACLGGALAVPHGGPFVPPGNPEDGKVAEGRYKNEYSKIAYRLASDRGEDRHGPAPSYADYYVPTALKGGVGLFRAMLVAESRCHFVSFNLTTVDPDGLASLAQSLNDLSLGEPADRARSMPICLKDYATPEHLLSRIEPASARPKFTSVPVRIIIGVDGRVRHIHVIRASAEQRESITAALTGWQFRSFTMEGRPVEVETGVAFRF
jgi:hypothetical protein